MVVLYTCLTPKLFCVPCGTAPLCLIFDPLSKLQGSVRAFVNKNGFGIMFSLEGYINLFLDVLKDWLKWPPHGYSMYYEISLEVIGDLVEVCLKKEKNTADLAFGYVSQARTCIATCKKDSQCPGGYFCNLLGFCEF